MMSSVMVSKASESLVIMFYLFLSLSGGYMRIIFIFSVNCSNVIQKSKKECIFYCFLKKQKNTKEIVPKFYWALHGFQSRIIHIPRTGLGCVCWTLGPWSRGACRLDLHVSELGIFLHSWKSLKTGRKCCFLHTWNIFGKKKDKKEKWDNGGYEARKAVPNQETI